MKHIVLTGGGTAGHVTPNIALIPKLKEAGYKNLLYRFLRRYGAQADRRSRHSVLRNFIRKLRRYFDPKNFSDPFRVVKGYFEAKKTAQKAETKRCLLQRRLRFGTGCPCRQSM